MGIQNKMIEYLDSKSFKIETILGFSDRGTSALILECEKDHTHISIEIGNEDKDLHIRGGLTGKYLPKGQQVPKFKQKFKDTEIQAASTFFVKVVNWCSDHSTEGNLCEDAFSGSCSQ